MADDLRMFPPATGEGREVPEYKRRRWLAVLLLIAAVIVLYFLNEDARQAINTAIDRLGDGLLPITRS